MDIERYEALQALELDKVYKEILEEIEAGKFKVVSADEHLKELQEVLRLN